MASRVDKQTIPISALLVAVFLAGCTANHPPSDRHGSNQPHAAESKTAAARRIYPFSLIPGGVESATELQTYSAIDSNLAEHYRGIGPNLVLTKVDQDQRLYASYRMADAIYWTRNRVLVHVGEGVLSDGKDMVRARCGNRLSATPQLPVHQFEPPSVYTDRFIPQVVILQPPAVTEPYAPPLLPDFPEVTPPERATSPPAIETGGGRTAVPPAIVTGGAKVPVAINLPEPDTRILLLGGLLALATLKYRRTLVSRFRWS